MNSEKNQLFEGDSLYFLHKLPPQSVDFICVDLPFGCTSCSWDRPLSLDALWGEYRRLMKPRATVALFGTLRFGLELIQSAPRLFKYHVVLRKSRPSGFLDSKKRPLRAHEMLFIFSDGQGTYHPQKTPGPAYECHARATTGLYHQSTEAYQKARRAGTYEGRFPTDVWDFKTEKKRFHPTQKPVDLLERLILTYTDPDGVVLDHCMGSGSTGVAAVHTGRRFIGMELDHDFFEVSQKRISEALAASESFDTL